LKFRYKRKVSAAPTHETIPQSCHRSKRLLHARTARWKDDVFMSVSWLSDPAFYRAFLQKDPVAFLEKDSPPAVAGAALEMACRHGTTDCTEFPFAGRSD